MGVEKPNKIVYKDLSYSIMSAAYEVHQVLGPGFSENIYQEALVRELSHQGIKFERQKAVNISYKGAVIGEYRLDFVVEGKIVLEIKAVSEMTPLFDAQVYSYLKAIGLKLGILLNFGQKSLVSKRVVN